MSNFYALINRMKYIRRWCLMRANYDENLFEHSFQVAVIAHALALIKNKKFGGNVDADFVATAALFHDSSEVITGDMPTPVKYNNPALKSAYKDLEKRRTKNFCRCSPIFEGRVRKVFQSRYFKRRRQAHKSRRQNLGVY